MRATKTRVAIHAQVATSAALLKVAGYEHFGEELFTCVGVADVLFVVDRLDCASEVWWWAPGILCRT